MTTLALGLFILACGWKLYKDWRVTRFAALGNEGHPQYFGAAIAAAYLFCLASAVHATAAHFPMYRGAILGALTFVPHFLGERESLVEVNFLAAIAFWSFLLSLGLGWAFNRPLFRSSELIIAVAKLVGAVDQFEALLHRCLERGLLVAVTLKSGKVYIGVPEGSAPFDHERTWIALLPLASGYRTATGQLKITTPYAPQYSLLEAGSPGLSFDDFSVVLPRCEITSAQSFDLAAYKSFPGQELPDQTTRVGDLAQPTGPEHPTPKPTDDEEQTYVQLRREILSDDDRYRLGMYWFYLGALSAALLLLPESWLFAMLAFLLAWVFGSESVTRVMQPEDWMG